MATKLAHTPDPFQQAAIDSSARGIRMVAPAGSGKSETLARRIAKRIERDGIDPTRILVLTYDNAAKKSLKRFFDSLKISRHLSVQTYDGFAGDILKNHFPEFTDKHNFTFQFDNTSDHVTRSLRDEFDKRLKMYPLINWDGYGREPKDIRRSIKNEGYSYGDHRRERHLLEQWLASDYFRLPPLEGADPRLNTELSQLHQHVASVVDEVLRYDKKMSEQGRRDAEDKKLTAATLLRMDQEAQTSLKASYDEIVIDEAQDIARVDAILAWLAANTDTRVVLAGDDDQTIYAWKNASARFLRDPNLIFRDLNFETYPLDLNYRSPEEILAPALQLISNNAGRIEKFPASAVPHEGAIELHRSASDRAHDNDVIETVRREISTGELPENIAILCKTNWAVSQFTRALQAAEIPVVQASSEESVKESGVWVRTFSGAKGREWPVVVLTKINDDAVPNPVAIRRGEIDAERRLMYVAMTRASRRLHIHYVRADSKDVVQQSQGGKIIRTNGASRFLFESGLLQEEGAGIDSPADVALDAGPLFRSIGQATPEPTALADMAAKPPVTVQRNEVESDTEKPIAPPKRSPVKKTRVESRGRRATKPSMDDINQTLRDEWHSVERLLLLGARDQHIGERPNGLAAIDYLHARGFIDSDWRSRLHRWRVARNHAEHHLFELREASISRSEYIQRADDIRERAGFARTYLKSIGTRGNARNSSWMGRLLDISRLVSSVELHQSGDSSIQAVATYPIHTDGEIDQAVGLQMHMLLRGVRFMVPAPYRWNESPLFHDYVGTRLGSVGIDLRKSATCKLAAESTSEADLLFGYMDAILDFECGAPERSASFLQDRIQEAVTIKNGQLSDGLVLTPVEGAAS